MDRNDHRLVRISDLPPIFLRIVIFISGGDRLFAFFGILHKRVQWAHIKVNFIDLISPLVIGCQHSRPNQLFFDLFPRVISAPLLDLLDGGQHCISSQNFVDDVDVQQNPSLELSQGGGEPRPYLYVMLVNWDFLIWVEVISTDLLELYLFEK